MRRFCFTSQVNAPISALNEMCKMFDFIDVKSHFSPQCSLRKTLFHLCEVCRLLTDCDMSEWQGIGFKDDVRTGDRRAEAAQAPGCDRLCPELHSCQVKAEKIRLKWSGYTPVTKAPQGPSIGFCCDALM